MKNIDIRNLGKIGVTDIDVYRTERSKKISSGSFMAYPRIWNDDYFSYNYSFDWNRHNDDKFSLRSFNKDILLNGCIEGKDEFLNEYESDKKAINSKDYYPPFLRMFKNHGELTGKNVILSVYITYDDFKNIIDDRVFLEYDSNIFDVGFTNDGKNISNKDFLFEKKFFKQKDFYINDSTDFKIEFYNTEKQIVFNNLLIKCKNTFSEDKQIKFLNNKNEIVGYLTVKPNKDAIFSKRKFRYVKLKRKSSSDKDLKTIKDLILNSYIKDDKSEGIKYNNENDFLDKFTKLLVGNFFSRITTTFSTEFLLDELEIDDAYLEQANIIKNGLIYKSVEYLDYVENKYIKEKNITEEQVKQNIYLFISPIEEEKAPDEKTSTAAYVVTTENIYNFSAMLFKFDPAYILHELCHEMGLIHTFETKQYLKNLIETRIKYLEDLKKLQKYYKDNETLISDWKKDLETRPSSGYPFMLGNEKILTKVAWKEKITKFEKENIANMASNEKTIMTEEIIIKFFEKKQQLQKTAFKKRTTDNIMDYTSAYYGFFNYQFNLITKLHEEFNHI